MNESIHCKSEKPKFLLEVPLKSKDTYASRIRKAFRYATYCFLAIWLMNSNGYAQQNIQSQKIQLKTRRGEIVQAEKGLLTVPSSRAKKNDAKLKIAYIRVPGPEGGKVPPTFVLAGGPGDSGIQVVLGMVKNGGQQVRQLFRGDLIGIDQRGTGESQPNLSDDTKFQLPLNQAGTKQEYAKRITRTFQTVASKLRKKGLRLEDFNVRENAADIVDLSKALGYKKISLWGTSFGSHLGLSIIKYHGERVHQAVFHSPEGPDHTWKTPKTIQPVLARIAKNDPKVIETMKRVFKKVEKNPITVETYDRSTRKKVKVTIGAYDLKLMAWSALSKTETMRQFAAGFRAMDRGNFQFPAIWVARFRRTAGVENAMKHLMDYSSGASAKRQKEISKSRQILGDVINLYLECSKKGWGVSTLGGSHCTPVRSNCRVLVFVGDHDIKTPVANAKEILRTLPNGHLVIIKGGGHGFRPHPEAMKIIAKFYREERVPKESSINGVRIR